MAEEKIVFQRPHALLPVVTNYCPGCVHGIVNRLVAETIDELGVGASESFTTTYTVTEEDILKGHVRNVATAEGDKVPDPKNPDDPKKPAGEDEQDDPTDEPDASLTVVKSLTNRPNKGYFTLGETAEFDVVVTNTGNVTLKNIRLTEMLDGAEFVTGEGYTVKNGRKDQPVERITVAGNFYQLLKNIRAVGSDLCFPGSSMGSPSVDVGEIAVAGK